METITIETAERLPVWESAADDPLLRSAALLAGLGRHLPALLPELSLWNEPAAAQNAGGPARTCIEAGAGRMLSLAAPGCRALRVQSRLAPAAGGIAPWLRLHASAQGGVLTRERWRTETLAGESPEALPRALAAARRAGAEERLRRCHAYLGAGGRICLVSWSLGRGPARAAVAWALDRTLPPSRALAACGAPDAWPAAAEILSSLIGGWGGERAVERGGPWSLLVEWTGGDGAPAPRLRLGTTAWARRPEDGGKRRRLAAAIAALGGDGPFAEALYKLIAAAAPTDSHQRIGRAVEIQIENSRVVGLEAYLRLPETLPLNPPTERT